MDSQLEPPKVLVTLAKTLPQDCTSLASPHIALAALVHAIYVNLEFRLTPEHAVSSEVTIEQERRIEASRLPDGWGLPGRDLSLAYKHGSSAMSFETGVSKVGGRAIVNAVAVEDSKTKTLDLVITDYFSSSSFPVSTAVSSPSTYESMFASPARLKDLISLCKTGIIQPLIPGLLKGALDETEDVPVTSSSAPRRGYYPDPGGPFVGGVPQQNQPGFINRIPPIGRSDLDPLAGLGGTTAGRVPLGGIEGDGMILGPNHPMFRDRRFPGEEEEERNRFWAGGDQFLPPGAVPPGARFDPVGPGMPAPGRGRGGGAFGARNFGDAMRPPGNDYDNMFM